MASTFSTNLKIELMVTGANAGTWGSKTNTNLQLAEQAISGYESINVTATTVALTMDDGAISQARNMVVEFAGTLLGASTVTMPDSVEKMYVVKDSTTRGGHNLTFKTASGTGFDPDNGKIHLAYSDGTNLNEIALNTLGGEVGSASIADNAVITAKISDNQIVTAKISDNQITTVKLSNDAVTTVKISNNAVTADKLERKFTITTNVTPAGGANGDLWFVYSQEIYMASETYVHNGTEFKNANNIYVNVSGTFQGVDEAYANVGGTYKLVFSSFQATSFVTLSTGTGTFTVPENANAIHIKSAVAGGGGAARGGNADSGANGESAGAGGGSGAYISDTVFIVAGNETLTYSVGVGGAPGNDGSNADSTAGDGTVTSLSASVTGSLFTLGGGGGSSGTGSDSTTLRTNTAGSAGSATVASGRYSSGTFRDSDGLAKLLTTLTTGPTGNFNDSGNGAQGNLTGTGNCSGSGCRISGFGGAPSFAGNIAGGTAGSSIGSGTNGGDGSRGSGAGGGAAQTSITGATLGGTGGAGEMVYRFMRVA